MHNSCYLFFYPFVYSMASFLNWSIVLKLKKQKNVEKRTQYYLDENTPQIDIQIQCNPYENPNWPGCRNGRADLKITKKYKGLRITKTTVKKTRVGRVTLPGFISYYMATVIKTRGADTHITGQTKSPGRGESLTFMVNWFLTMLLVQLNTCMQKNAAGLLPNIMFKD